MQIKLSAHLNGMQDTLGAVDRELGRVEELKLQVILVLVLLLVLVEHMLDMSFFRWEVPSA